MEPTTFDAWTRRRFAAVAVGLSALIGLGFGEQGAAKGKNKKPKKQSRCRADGTSCGKESKQCQAKFCLHAPFRVEASWTSDFSHDAYLFVPLQNGNTGPGPYLNFSCNEGNSNCASTYPFACINEDEDAPGDGVTKVSKLLPGTYQYWVLLHDNTAAGELTIVLRDKGGRVVQEWTNPANLTNDQLSWHVFDLDGKRGSITSVDETVTKNLPGAGADPFTFVCGF